MNKEKTHTQEHAPVSSSHQFIGRHEKRHDLLGQMLPPLLKSQGGLAIIPQATLRQNLQPVLNALERLDAERLLDLQPAARGPHVIEE